MPARPLRDQPHGLPIPAHVNARRVLGIAYACDRNKDEVHSPKVLSDVRRDINQNETPEGTQRTRMQRDWRCSCEWHVLRRMLR